MIARPFLYTSLLTALQCLSASALQQDTVREVGGRSLVAASKRSSFKPRSHAIEFYNSADFVYADNTLNAGQSFAAKVSVSSTKPIFVLEDFEHLFSDVRCEADTITLTRPPPTGLWQRHTFDQLVNGHIITSHHGCNTEHGRRPHRVQAIEFLSDSILVLSTTPTSWRESFDTFKVEMGYTPDTHIPRQHLPSTRYLHARRQIATGTPALIPFNASKIPTLANPAPEPSSTQTAYGFDLSSSLIDKSLGPFETPVGEVPVEIGCVNCTTFGKLDVTFASFDWNCGFNFGSEDAVDCLTGGANVTTKGLGAHVLMSANLSSSFTFEVPISVLQAKFKIEIPEIGSAGVVFGNFLAGGYELDGEVGLTYGFDLKVPDGSNIAVDIIDPSDSTITGFDKSIITAIPVQTSAEIQSLELFIALRAVLKATFEFQDRFQASGDFGAGVYVDLPVLSANITPVTNVDSTCKPLSAASLPSGTGLNASTSAIDVDFSAGFDFGAFVEAEATILGAPFNRNEQSINFQKLFPIGSGCFDFKNNSALALSPNGTSTGLPDGQSNVTSYDPTNAASSARGISSAAPLLFSLFVVSSIFSVL